MEHMDMVASVWAERNGLEIGDMVTEVSLRDGTEHHFIFLGTIQRVATTFLRFVDMGRQRITLIPTTQMLIVDNLRITFRMVDCLG